MGRRALQLLLVAFQVVWLNVVVPGHTRGDVRMPGGPGDATAGPVDSCCAPPPAKADDRPAGDPAKGCAVCYFAAGLDTPPPFTFVHPPALAAERAEAAVVAQRESSPPPHRYRSRAPPAPAER